MNTKIVCLKNKENGESVWKGLECIAKSLVCIGSSEINSKEINDILMIISNDPDKLTFFDLDYGSQNVEAAIKKASKTLYPNGVIDECVSDYLWCKRDELLTSINVSHLTEGSMNVAWHGTKTVTSALFSMNSFHIPEFQRYTFERLAQKSELLVLMAFDPDSLRKKEVCREIGQSRCEIGISICKHILESLLKRDLNLKLAAFQRSRNIKIMQHGKSYLRKIIANYDDIFHKVRLIVNNYWEDEPSNQIDALSVLFIMEPKMVYSKFVLNSAHCSSELLAIIEDGVKICINEVDERKKFFQDTMSIVDGNAPSVPIVAELKCSTKNQKEGLTKYLRQSKCSSILEFSANYIVCSNADTFEWLKTVINDKNDLSHDTPMSVTVTSIQVDDHKLKRVGMLSQLKLSRPFHTYLENIKRHYPNLRTELWKCLESVSDWKMYVGIDIDSIIQLEQHKRRIQVDEFILKFQIFYTLNPYWD